MTHEESEPITIEALAEAFLEARKRGEAPSLDDYAARHPVLANEIRMLFPLLVDVHGAPTVIGEAPTVSRPEVGKSIDDFDLLTELGRGSFATVFLARQRSMQRLVALKVSRDSGTEHHTLARLDHDHIVRVHDVRRCEDLRLLYMQYVPGGTLQEVNELAASKPPGERSGQLVLEAIDESLERRGEGRPALSGLRSRLAGASWPEAVAWLGARLASALHYAHEHGVLHRDVKPANVLLSAEGSPRLVDFNVSYADEQPEVTADSSFGGSVPYMSPEQMEACLPGLGRTPEDLDGRTDVYSLGIVLWELLTGCRPFSTPAEGQPWREALVRMHSERLGGVPEAARATLPADCPAALGPILLRCLAPDREDRPANAEIVAQELQLCLHPHVQDLLHPSPWRRFLRHWPIPTVALATLLPNGVAARFNFIYNKTEVIDHLPEAEASFWGLVEVVNGIGFPLGVAIFLVLIWPLARGLAHPPDDPERLADLRRRSLQFSHSVALIGLGMWALAGIAYPIVLRMAVGFLPVTTYAHFTVSHLICALIATSYPFFLNSFLQLQVFYPAFVRLDWDAHVELPHLQQLGRRVWVYLALAGVLPMFTLGILLASGAESRTILFGLSVVGFVGMAAITALMRSIQADLNALIRALRSTSETTDATLADPL